MERQYDELMKMFKADTVMAMLTLHSYPSLSNAIFSGNLWLKPTLEAR